VVEAGIVRIAAGDEPARAAEKRPQPLAAADEVDGGLDEYVEVRAHVGQNLTLPGGELGEGRVDACPECVMICGCHVPDDTVAGMVDLDLSLAAHLRAEHPSFSFEFFPPKDDEGEEVLWRTISELEPLDPTFVSVTYGAGGTSQERTVRITARIAEQTQMRAIGHLTLVSQSKGEIESVLKQYAAAGIDHVLALRGDPKGGPRAVWEPHPDGMTYAIDLVELAGDLGGFCIGVAAFPEGHPDAESIEADAEVLVAKARAGAEYAITQLFFRSSDYFTLVDRVRALGCDIPIIPGIMPILNFAQVARMAELSGAEIPREVLDEIEPIADDKVAVRSKGIELATQLCRDLLAGGAPGLHFITLNRSKATREIFERLRGEGRI
jgi:methylenetetrahydrofolate reductase (NADPH)